MIAYQSGRPELAIPLIQKAIRVAPRAPYFLNLGAALKLMGRIDEAIEAFSGAAAMDPNFAQAHNNLGSALKDRGEMEGAIACFNRALSIRPDYVSADSNRVYDLLYHPDYNAADILRETRLWNDRHAAGLKPKGADIPSPAPTRNSRLRVGYVSPHFHHHVVSLFTMPLLSHHDREEVEVYCYSYGRKSDAVTDRLKSHADHWRDIASMNDAQAADLIRRDNIDILIDLTLHMAGNRLLIFAHKPAPIQITWLGYPGTTGLATMDYRLTDPHLDPPGQNGDPYAEKSVCLPDTFWCIDLSALDGHGPPDPGPLPAKTNGHVTFGCLNNFCKINDGVLAIWSGALRATPRSRLRVMAPRGEARRRLLATLASHGVEAQRVDFVDQQAREPYFLEYRKIDICLDTLPYNGHTTSLDSYWMGVPVVSRVGRTVVGRAGWSQLSNLGLTELAAFDDARFTSIATELAGDLPRLSHLRSTLRERMASSPLTDAARFARGMEAIYRRLSPAS